MDFETTFAPRLGVRAEGFGKLFEMLNTKRVTTPELVIVETGCVRMRDNWLGDGYSSVLFSAFAHEHHARFFSIDAEPNHCALARELCATGTFMCGDSVQTLYGLRQSLSTIDLLYLDSFDLDWNNPYPSALHHLQELCAAAPMLKKGSMVCVDDNNGTAGKGMYIRQYMRKIAAEQLFEGYQIVFQMP